MQLEPGKMGGAVGIQLILNMRHVLIHDKHQKNSKHADIENSNTQTNVKLETVIFTLKFYIF